MSKTTKILTTVVAIALVITAMVVGIYAATSGSAAINATVNWTAAQGITFTLDGSVVNGKAEDAKSIDQIVVTSSTSNTEAIQTAAKDLNINFYDGTDNGVNDPSNIVFTYTLKNTGETNMKVTLTKKPAEAQNVKVAATAKVGEGADVYTALTGEGTQVDAGATLVVTITLSMEVPADTSVTGFDAGVTFAMAMAA